MTIEDQVKKITRSLLKTKGLTAGELAVKCGFAHGREINRALSHMKRTGAIQIVAKRPAKYTQPETA